MQAAPRLEGARKRSRNTVACHSCRARKVKCLGKPPNACPNCLDIGTQCNWASADGRSAEARSRRLKSRNASTADVTGIHRAPDQQNTAIIQGAPGSMSTSVVPFVWPAGSTDTMYNSAEAMPPGSSTVLPWSTLEDFFNTFAGPQGSDTPLRGLAAPEIVAPNDFGDSVFGHITDRGDGVTKIMWLRICGQTAIVPGAKKRTLKLQSAPSNGNAPLGSTAGSHEHPPPSLIGADGRPKPSLMLHLLGLFFSHVGSQFPHLDQTRLEDSVRRGEGSAFLLNCIAAISSRFSTHPDITASHSRPAQNASVFTNKAKAMLGSMLSVPSRDTIVSFLLLSMVAAGDDSESDVWMMVGMAVRMSIDLGIHRHRGVEEGITERQARLDRLLFGSVIFYDISLAFGVGRPPSFHLADITQQAPTEDDMRNRRPIDLSADHPISPFPFVVRQMTLLGHLVAYWNTSSKNVVMKKAAQEARSKIIDLYSSLPVDLLWSSTNLRRQASVAQGLIFVNFHLWFHTMLAMDHVAEHPIGEQTSGSSEIRRHSIGVIAEILNYSDLIDPFAYLAQPLINTCYIVASNCYLKGESSAQIDISRAPETVPSSSSGSYRSGDLYALDSVIQNHLRPDPLLASDALNKVAQFVTGLDRMTHYWDGIAWIAGTIKQRLAGEDEIDLAKITADLENCVVSGDPGAIAEMSDPGPKPLSGPAAAAVATPAPQPWAAPYQYTAPSGDNGLFDPSLFASNAGGYQAVSGGSFGSFNHYAAPTARLDWAQ